MPKKLPIDLYVNIKKKLGKKIHLKQYKLKFTSKVLFIFGCVKIRCILPLPNMGNLIVSWIGYLSRVINDAHRVSTRPEVDLG